jgi:hypothetical protein
MLAATQGHGGTLVAGLVLAVAFALWSFSLARRFRDRNGVAPWRLHPLLWALIGFVLGLIGFLLILVARATTRPVPPAPTGPGSSVPDGGTSVDDRWAGPASPPDPAGSAAVVDAPSPLPVAAPAPQPAPASRSLTAIEPSFDPPGSPPEAYSPETAQQGPVPDWPEVPPAGTSPQWLPDPTGRDGYRYFDGTRWTPFVYTRVGASVHHL